MQVLDGTAIDELFKTDTMLSFLYESEVYSGTDDAAETLLIAKNSGDATLFDEQQVEELSHTAWTRLSKSMPAGMGLASIIPLRGTAVVNEE